VSGDSLVSIATGYELDARGSNPERGLSPQRPERLWRSTGLLFNGYWGLFPPGVKMATYVYLGPRSRMLELYLHSPIRFGGVVLNL
jgi:hypothetical protein